jgi:transposase
MLERSFVHLLSSLAEPRWEGVAADAILAQRYELLTSMRGVGPTLAFTLIALLPELGQISRKQIAALVGLAPYDGAGALRPNKTGERQRQRRRRKWR